MARNAPSFVINAAKARHLNIAHGLYPRGHLSEQQLSAVVRYLRQYVTTQGGRVYAGGLVKFEPLELERLRIPALEQLHEHVPNRWTLQELQADAATVKGIFRHERVAEPLDLYKKFFDTFAAIFRNTIGDLPAIALILLMRALFRDS